MPITGVVVAPLIAAPLFQCRECHSDVTAGQLESGTRDGAAAYPMADFAGISAMNQLKTLTAALVALLASAAASRADDPPRYTGWSVSMPTTTRDGGTEEIPATILKPPGDGPFPAIVVLHDCSGLSVRSSGAPMRWATLLAAQGYVTIIPDSFSTRGFPAGVCTAAEEVVPQLRRVAPIQRAYDAYGALAYLRTLAYVDGVHIGVMGGSHGGSSTLAAMVTPASDKAPLVEERRHGFAAGLALYPGCANRYGTWSAAHEHGTYGAITA